MVRSELYFVHFLTNDSVTYNYTYLHKITRFVIHHTPYLIIPTVRRTTFPDKIIVLAKSCVQLISNIVRLLNPNIENFDYEF